MYMIRSDSLPLHAQTALATERARRSCATVHVCATALDQHVRRDGKRVQNWHNSDCIRRMNTRNRSGQSRTVGRVAARVLRQLGGPVHLVPRHGVQRQQRLRDGLMSEHSKGYATHARRVHTSWFMYWSPSPCSSSSRLSWLAVPARGLSGHRAQGGSGAARTVGAGQQQRQPHGARLAEQDLRGGRKGAGVSQAKRAQKAPSGVPFCAQTPSRRRRLPAGPRAC